MDGGGESILSYIDTLIDFQLPDSGRKYSDEELVSLCSEFFHGGTDTSITTLQWAMANIVKHQHIQEKLLQEINAAVKPGEEITEEDLRRMPYLKSVILETLRRHPPGHFILPHGVTDDTKLEGYDVPRNSIINFTVADMGWDANVWEDPIEFRPERFLKNGDGDQEVVFDLKEYFVANLVRDFAWTAENGGDIDLSEKRTGFHHGHEDPTSRACFSKNTLKMVLNTKNMLFKLFRPFLAWNAPAGYSTVKGTRHLQSQAWFRSFLRCCVIVLVSGID
ncbi:hypothetical protein OIU76_004209 [Salix suchowensis]|nr:hypothetical protein OIU76_004209 [Salix suchowensis]